MATDANKSAGGIKRVRGTRAKKKAETKPAAPAKKEVTPEKKEPTVRVRREAPQAPAKRKPGSFLSLQRGASTRSINDFLRQFIMLVEAGTPILKSLQTLAQRSEQAAIRSLTRDMAEYVEAGNPLWQAFERHRNYFDPVFINIVKASEASGTLVPVLRRQVVYREHREMLKKRIQGALLYPALVVVFIVAVLFVMSEFVLPVFSEMFTKMEIEPPTISRVLMGFLTFISDMWWVILLAFAGLVLLYMFIVRNSPTARLKADRLKLRIPLVGPKILRKRSIVEMTRTMALLLRSGLSMMVTLDLTRYAVNNRAMQLTLQRMRDSVERGEGLEGALRREPRVITPVVADLMITGEETGQLDSICEQIADQYEEEVNIGINAMVDLLTPVLVIFMGGLVIILALAVFLPLLSMMDAAQSTASGGAL